MLQKIKDTLKWQYIRDKLFYKKLIKQGDICFDIGANVGYKSKLFLALGAKVVAIEPQSKCLEDLKKIKHKEFSFVNCGVGAKDEIKDLRLANHSEVATFSQSFIDYFRNENLKWKQKEAVQIKKLDTLINNFGLPNYCKIDVEGYEYEILSELSYQIPIIEFEFTAAFVLETVACIELLNKSTTVYNFNLHERPKFELKHWVNAPEMITILKKLPVDRLHGNIFVKTHN